MNYPRVLLVHINCINESDQNNMSLRGWFGDFPKASLAQIYSGAENDGDKFCDRTFKLGLTERHWGTLFFRFKGTVLGQTSQLVKVENNKLKKVNKKTLVINKIGKLLLDSGLWELIFFPKLSSILRKWIEDYSPDVIYCQGYDLTFSWLPLVISEKLNIPIIFQTTDDWPNYLYKNSPIVHPIVLHTAAKLIKKASTRFAICDRMATDFQKQFGEPFETLMICDNVERFFSVLPQRISEKGVVSIVYSGGLGLERWKSLLDLCSAAEAFEKEGIKVLISAFTTSVPVEATNLLLDRKNLQILPPVSHEQLPSFLSGADILFLPETFNPKLAQEIRYSISQKSQLYMMSGQPILVYGSPLAGVVDYAKQDGWAYVVDKPQINMLTEAIRNLSCDNILRTHLIKKAHQVALKNHDEKIIRSKLFKGIQSIFNEETIN